VLEAIEQANNALDTVRGSAHGEKVEEPWPPVSGIVCRDRHDRLIVNGVVTVRRLDVVSDKLSYCVESLLQGHRRAILICQIVEGDFCPRASMMNARPEDDLHARGPIWRCEGRGYFEFDALRHESLAD
jgi:hypothetical protein